MTATEDNDVPDEIREITRHLLAGEAQGKADLLKCAEWWCKNTTEDNVITDLIVLELYLRREPLTPHERERLEDERDMAIYHLKGEYPTLVPGHGEE